FDLCPDNAGTSRQSDCRSHLQARRRSQSTRSKSRRCHRGVGRNDKARGKELSRADHLMRWRWAADNERHSHLRRYRPRLYRERELPRHFYARVSKMGIDLSTKGNRIALRRSLCRERWMESDESVGEILRGGDGISKYPDL